MFVFIFFTVWVLLFYPWNVFNKRGNAPNQYTKDVILRKQAKNIKNVSKTKLLNKNIEKLVFVLAFRML
jgi:hypothetical protein